MFAAYSQKSESEQDNLESKTKQLDWLVNSSFLPANVTPVVTNVEGSSDKPLVLTGIQEVIETSDSHTLKHKLKKASKKKKKEKKKTRKGKGTNSEELKKFNKLEEYNKSSKKSVLLRNLQSEHEQAFFEDLRGDKDNFAFPNMYFKHVARYDHMRNILGYHQLKPCQTAKCKPLRYFGKKAQIRLAKINSLPCVQPKLSESNPLGVYDKSTIKYIEGQGYVTEPNKEQSLWGEEMEAARKTALFNEKLRKNPNDITLWMLFVEHQDTCFSQSESISDSENINSKKQSKSSSHRALLERKVSIFDKAIEQNPKNVDLITARLNLAMEYWDASALHQEWRNVLFVNPALLQLWKEYLRFMENYFEGFNVTQILKAYANCLQKLMQMTHSSFAVHQRPSYLEESMIDVFTSACAFLRQTGWQEKCVSLTQAFLELNLKRSHDVSSPLLWLRKFWESSSRRFGEVEASIEILGRGPQRAVNGIDLSEAEDAIVSSRQEFPVIWRQMELLRSYEQWQASSSANDCDDEERFVSFSDMSQYLFVLEKTPHLQHRAVVGCLASLGVPLIPSSQAQLFWSPYVREDNIVYCLTNVPGIALMATSVPDIINSTSYLAFIRRVVIEAFKSLEQPYKLELALWWLHVERIRLRRATQYQSSVDINKTRREAKTWIKSFLKDIPRNDSISTITLYNGYAEIEQQFGKKDDSQRVLDMLLQMYQSNPLTMKQSEKGSKAALIKTWLLYALSMIDVSCINSQQKVMAHLVGLGVGSTFTSSQLSPPTPALLLKAKRKYETTIQELTESNNEINFHCFNLPDEIVELLGCYSYLLSFTDGCQAALQMVRHWLASTKKTEMEFVTGNRYSTHFLTYHHRRESLYVNLLELLTVCRSWVKDYQPRLFHDVLSTALSEYPESMQLLAVLIESEERCNMFSSLWNDLSLRAKSGKNSSSNRAALAACLTLASREERIRRGEEKIFKEFENDWKGIPILYVSYQRKLKHLAERCVAQPPGRYFPMLWRILMRNAYCSKNPERCKALFYRAVRDCPSSKDICMDIIEYVPTSLKEVTNLMKEKDLRVRLPVEELNVLLEIEKEDLDEDVHQHDVTCKYIQESIIDEPFKTTASEGSEGSFSDDFRQDSDDENDVLV